MQALKAIVAIVVMTGVAATSTDKVKARYALEPLASSEAVQRMEATAKYISCRVLALSENNSQGYIDKKCGQSPIK